MKEVILSNKNRKRKRHDSQMPRIKTLKSTKTHKHLPYRHENKWQIFYGSRAWQNLRNEQIMDNPLCEHCLLEGKIKSAQCVHHRIPFSEGITDEDKWKLFLDDKNLISLCNDCHRKIHAGLFANEEYQWIKHL